MVIVSEND